MRSNFGLFMIWLALMGIGLQLGMISDKMPEPTVHKCREYILLDTDTVEVIYTKHENRHFRK